MSRPLRVQYEGAFYHIIARGQRRESIFRNDGDRDQFLERLEITISKYNLRLHAYCQMDNHYHLLLETPEGNLSQAMRYFNGSYANYFRAKHRLVGSIFQGRYKSIIVEKDDYLLQLSAYIHLNPVRAKIVEKPEDYKWSSFQYYFKNADIPDFLYVDEISGKYGDDYAHHVYEIMRMPKNEIDELLNVKKSVLGSDALISHVLECAKERKGARRDVELPEYTRLKYSAKEKIFDIITSKFGITVEDILARKRGNVYRKLAIYGLKMYTRLKLNEIGEIFDLHYHTVAANFRLFMQQQEKDSELMRMKSILDEEVG